jgi:hypothetical protein
MATFEERLAPLTQVGGQSEADRLRAATLARLQAENYNSGQFGSSLADLQRQPEMRAARSSPTDWIGDRFADSLMSLGMQPYTATDLRHRLGNLAMASPLGIAGSAMDAVHAKATGDDFGTVSAMAGMLPGAGPEARAALNEVRAASRFAPLIELGDKRVSTRFPTAVKAEEDPLRQHLSIGTEEMKADPANFEHNTAILSRAPGFEKLKGMSPDEAAATYIDQAKGNLQYLYDRSPPEMKARSPSWYEGANEISDALANRWGVPRQSVSAAMASLSPQKDWFMNASLGERVGDIVTNNPKATSEMVGWIRSQPKIMAAPGAEEAIQSMTGKRLDQVDPQNAALFVRAFDEAHNTRNYRTIMPEGGFGDFVRTGAGDPSKVAWGTFGDIDKARRAIQSGGDMDVISPLLGGKHKVRSFYNNIEVPNDPRFGDITADTHQVGC